MHSSVWGGNNVDPSTWIDIYLIQIAAKGQHDLKLALRRPATLKRAVEELVGKGIDVDVSTLSRMKRINDCHARLSDKMKRVRTEIVESISLDVCFLYFEQRLLSSMMFSISNGDLSHHSRNEKSPSGLYKASRFSLRGKRRVTQSAFLFYRNEKVREPLSGYSEIESGMYAKDAFSEVHRYRELRKITPLDDAPFFIHSRGLVFLLNDGFYLIGTSLETTKSVVTSQLQITDIRRSQVEHEFLEDDKNPAILRGVKPGFLRAPAHPVSAVIHLHRVGDFSVDDWDRVGQKVSIGTVNENDLEDPEVLGFDQDSSTGMLTVRTL